jgi:vancomycin resistance protein VanW
LKKRTIIILSSVFIFSFCLFAFLLMFVNISGKQTDKNSVYCSPSPNAPIKLSDQPKEVSGQIEALPWDNDQTFISFQQYSGANVLLGAYRTVLPNPLPGEEFNVHLAATYLKGYILKPGQILSQNNIAGPYTTDRGYRYGPTYIGGTFGKTIGGGVCKVASTLYNVSILSNLKIIERNNHSMPVPYVPYGQDATVSYGNLDFKVKNNMDYPILVWAQGIGNNLYIAFYGREKPPEITWHHLFLNSSKAPDKVVINPQLPQATSRLILEGMDGATVKSWITIRYPDGTEETKQLGISFYLPIPNYYEKGP